jgi:DNA polymerase I-like protein with 3'-5' exonuclease and polymerase domains
MRVAAILAAQQRHGWRFDVKGAQKLDDILRTEIEALSRGVIDKHPLIFDKEFTPKRPNKTKGWHADVPFSRLKDLNPTSRDQIAWVLTTFYGWEPSKFTDTHKAVVDETTLKSFGTPEGLTFYRMFELTKQLGLLSEGKNGWLRMVTPDERIHHRAKVDTATHRCSHSSPNLAQTPSDLRFRALFLPDEGQCMVGADLAAIELRMLAHYLARYDGGEYATNLLEDDIHQVTADRIGITRKQVKTVTYAFMYGAGDEKIGYSYDPNLTDAQAKKKGKEIRASFVAAIPGLDQLIKDIKLKVKLNCSIKSVDGRTIKVDSEHKGLNYLLQSGAGVIAKRWMVEAHSGLPAYRNVHQLAFVHDELQFTCPDDESAPHLATILTTAARTAGEHYNLRIPIAAEAKIGNNWAEVH